MLSSTKECRSSIESVPYKDTTMTRALYTVPTHRTPRAHTHTHIRSSSRRAAAPQANRRFSNGHIHTTVCTINHTMKSMQRYDTYSIYTHTFGKYFLLYIYIYIHIHVYIYMLRIYIYIYVHICSVFCLPKLQGI